MDCNTFCRIVGLFLQEDRRMLLAMWPERPTPVAFALLLTYPIGTPLGTYPKMSYPNHFTLSPTFYPLFRHSVPSNPAQGFSMALPPTLPKSPNKTQDG